LNEHSTKGVEHDPSAAAGVCDMHFTVRTSDKRPYVAVLSLFAEGPKGQVTFVGITQIKVFAVPTAKSQRHA
jgi:hypothetical protein